MSYKHLAGRLIETQRSMLGESALKIARSVDGISVDNDGSVSALTGDSRAVVDALSQRYMEMLGAAAEDRLLAAAREFEGDLILPPSLGGPDDYAAVADDRPDQGPTTVDPADAGPAAADSSVDAMSDGGAITVQSAAGADGAAEEPTRAKEELEAATPIPEPVRVEYTVASSLPGTADGDTDLESVYLMPRDGDGWQAPVSVSDAVADALSAESDLDDDSIDGFVDSIGPERLLATLNDENGETVSFHHEGITVTFHRTGSLAVH